MTLIFSLVHGLQRKPTLFFGSFYKADLTSSNGSVIRFFIKASTCVTHKIHYEAQVITQEYLWAEK